MAAVAVSAGATRGVSPPASAARVGEHLAASLHDRQGDRGGSDDGDGRHPRPVEAMIEPRIQRPVAGAHERQRRRGHAEQGGVLVTAAGREEAAGRVDRGRRDHGACRRRACCGRGETECDENTTTGLTQSGRECGLPARLEAHLLERGAGTGEPMPTEPPEEFLYTVGDQYPTDAGPQGEQPGVLLPRLAHDRPFESGRQTLMSSGSRSSGRAAAPAPPAGARRAGGVERVRGHRQRADGVAVDEHSAPWSAAPASPRSRATG